MRWQTFRRLLANRTAAAGLVLVTAAVVVALLCPWLAPFDPDAQYRGYTKMPPGTQMRVDAAHPDGVEPATRRFWLGTDVNGRDILSRVLYGARVSLLVGLIATLLNLVIGATLGLIAGYAGGWLDGLLMRITDTFFAFPGMLLAIIIMATLKQESVYSALQQISGGMDPGLWGLFFALGITGWTGTARVIRGQVLSLKEQEFVEGARAIGCSQTRIILVHLLPNCLAPLIVLGTMQVAYNILSEAGLSFLGLGVQPPAASWGGMLSEGRPYLTSMPWWGVYPGLALALTVLGFNLFGDGLRDVLDPKLRLRN